MNNVFENQKEGFVLRPIEQNDLLTALKHIKSAANQLQININSHIFFRYFFRKTLILIFSGYNWVQFPNEELR